MGMQIFVKTLTGKTLTIQAEEDWTNVDIKNEVCLEENIPFADQKLILNGKVLEGNLTLREMEVQENAVIDLVISLGGGAATQMDPAIVELSKKYNHDKKICRKCYATLPPRAQKCRKRACGHWPDIRPRKVIKSK